MSLLHQLNLLVSAVAGIGVILPLFLILAATIWLAGRPDIVWRWGAGFVLCLAGTYFLKWLDAQIGLDPIFPSGHVSMAVYTFGGLAFLLIGRGRRRDRLGWAILVAIGLLVGVSRVILTTHDWLDVIGGIALGIACLPLVGCPRQWTALSGRTRALLLLVFVVAAVPVTIYGAALDRVLHRYVAY